MTRNTTNRILSSLYVSLLILFCAPIAYAAVDSWSLNSPQGGVIQTLAVDPNTANVIYAGTSANGIYKSIDAGTTWTRISAGLGYLDVQVIAIDPIDTNRIFAGTNGGGAYRSVNAGNTWTAINSGLINLNVYDITFDPIDNTRVYAATFGNVFSTSDRTSTSLTWGRLGVSGSGTRLAHNAVQTTVADSDNAGVYYAGTYAGGVYASTNNMNSWQAVNSGLTSLNVRHLSKSNFGNILYAGTQGGGFFIGTQVTTTNITWVASNTGLATTTINDVVEVDANVLYAASHNNVYRSTDSGLSWSALGTDLVGLRILTIAIDHNTNPKTIYAGTQQGVYKLSDGSTTWTATNTGITSFNITNITLDNVNPDLQYAATLGSGILKTTDAGSSWSYVNSGIDDLKALAVSVDGSNVYSGTEFGGVYKSTDGGASWLSTNTGLGNSLVSHIIDDSASSDVLYAATSSGINTTTNGATTWSLVSDVNNGAPAPTRNHDTRTLALAIDFASTSDRRIYLSTASSGVFYTPINSINWTNISAGLGNEFIYTIAIDPSNPNTLYAGSRGDGVYKSVDRGASWFAMNNGIKNNDQHEIVHVNAIAVNPNDSNIVYAGTETRGVYRSLNGGVTWTAVNSGLNNLKVKTLKVNPATNTLYAGTKGGGIFSIDFSSANTSPLVASNTPAGNGGSGGGGNSDFVLLLLCFFTLLLAFRHKTLIRISIGTKHA